MARSFHCLAQDFWTAATQSGTLPDYLVQWGIVFGSEAQQNYSSTASRPTLSKHSDDGLQMPSTATGGPSKRLHQIMLKIAPGRSHLARTGVHVHRERFRRSLGAHSSLGSLRQLCSSFRGAVFAPHWPVTQISARASPELSTPEYNCECFPTYITRHRRKQNTTDHGLCGHGSH